MSIVLLCAVAGAIVGGLTSMVLTGPQRRFDRRVAVLRAEALLNYGELLRPERPARCPVCVDLHRYADSDCDRAVSSR